jgi:hypothetical protein
MVKMEAAERFEKFPTQPCGREWKNTFKKGKEGDACKGEDAY